MSLNSSQGSQFSDGVRVGPGFQALYTNGVGGTPPVLIETSSLNKAAGTQLASWAVYDIAPAASAVNNISLALASAGAGYRVLAPGPGAIRVSKFGRQNVIELDVPRAISVTQDAAGTAGNFTIIGYDMYGIRMQEQINGILGETVNGVKAFKWVTAVYFSGASATPISVGTANVFGLPWRVDSGSYGTARYGNISGGINTPTYGSAVLVAGTVNVAAPKIIADSIVLTSRLVPGGGLGNISVVINPGIGFTINSDNAAETSTIAYELVYAFSGGTVIFTPAFQQVGPDPFPIVPSTLITPDVRGTVGIYSPGPALPNGVRRLTVFAYVLGSNVLPDDSIKNLNTYKNSSIPNEFTLNGYPQFWQDPVAGY